MKRFSVNVEDDSRFNYPDLNLYKDLSEEDKAFLRNSAVTIKRYPESVLLISILDAGFIFCTIDKRSSLFEHFNSDGSLKHDIADNIKSVYYSNRWFVYIK